MKQTGDPRNPRLEPSQPRAVIQMPPPAQRDMIVQGQSGTAFGATESSFGSMAKKNLDAFGFSIKMDTVYHPRPLQRKQLHEDIDVTHGEKFSVVMTMRILQITHRNV
jgi:hypothetical protein